MSKARESQKRKLSSKSRQKGTFDSNEETLTGSEKRGTAGSEDRVSSPKKQAKLKDRTSGSKDGTTGIKEGAQTGDIGTSATDKEATLNKMSSSLDDTDRRSLSVNRLPFSFFDKECVELAKSLLGQRLVHVVDGKRLVGKIVETEAYVGFEDKAAHSYKGKRTARNEAMFMAPGTAYVYNIYGMYCCLNISSKGEGAAVLLRALEPLENLSIMDKNRTGEKQKSLLKKDGKDLCNGPSKLCRALAITKETSDQVDMCTSDRIWLEKGENVEQKDIVKSKRINISYGEEWVHKLLRFYVYGNNFISVKDKEAEKLITE